MTMNLKMATAAGDLFNLFKKKECVDAEDFPALLEPVEDILYNFILKALNFSEDAQDVYQEAVLRALKYLSSFNPQRSFKTWMFTIACNEIRGYFNKHKQSAAPLDVEPAAHDDNPAEKEKLKAIYAVAGELKPKQREVFFLFYHNGFSMDEITEITGLKSGNIKFILNQAREAIKLKLGVKDES